MDQYSASTSLQLTSAESTSSADGLEVVTVKPNCNVMKVTQYAKDKLKPSLIQENKAFYTRTEEYWEPKLEGLERLKVNRDVPTIEILLTKDPNHSDAKPRVRSQTHFHQPVKKRENPSSSFSGESSGARRNRWKKEKKNTRVPGSHPSDSFVKEDKNARVTHADSQPSDGIVTQDVPKLTD